VEETRHGDAFLAEELIRAQVRRWERGVDVSLMAEAPGIFIRRDRSSSGESMRHAERFSVRAVKIFGAAAMDRVMSNEAPPRMVDDPSVPADIKRDLRRSSEWPLPPELEAELERIAAQDWKQGPGEEKR
jgi:hypothetical protein